MPHTPGLVDKLGGDSSNQFSRLASLGNFAVQGANTFARVPSGMSNMPNSADAFNRATSSFMPFPNTGFERVSSLTGAGVSSQLHEHHNALDAHGARLQSVAP